MDQRLRSLQSECRQILEENILKFWLEKMQDNENGGFYGQMLSDGTVVKTANKGGILNARLLWTFSSAYRITHNRTYYQAAKRCKDYIIEHFIQISRRLQQTFPIHIAACFDRGMKSPFLCLPEQRKRVFLHQRLSSAKGYSSLPMPVEKSVLLNNVQYVRDRHLLSFDSQRL